MLESISVSRLARYLKDVIEGDLKLSNLWVEGEISNLSRSTRGHVYFTLKEGAYALRCVMFQRQYRGAPLDNGAQVLAHGNVTFYEQRGDIQLVVDFVQPAGVGAKQAEFERLREKLAAEGLFAEERKRQLPAFPSCIGVVTSPSGAVFHDILRVISRRWPLAEIVLAPTPVQGVRAAIGVTEAIRQLNERPGTDVIIVARGGGSIEELWAFNEEIVARAIFASTVPVVSAVGHETDYTIADFVADVRAPTPSAAAEIVAPDWQQVWRQVRALMQAGYTAVDGPVRRRLSGMEAAGHRMRAAIPDPSRRLEQIAAMVRHAGAVLGRGMDGRSQGANACALQLRSLDPRATLARGYAVVQLREGKQAITSVHQVKGKDRLDVHVKDGRFPADVSRQYGF